MNELQIVLATFIITFIVLLYMYLDKRFTK